MKPNLINKNLVIKSIKEECSFIKNNRINNINDSNNIFFNLLIIFVLIILLLFLMYRYLNKKKYKKVVIKNCNKKL